MRMMAAAMRMRTAALRTMAAATSALELASALGAGAYEDRRPTYDGRRHISLRNWHQP